MKNSSTGLSVQEVLIISDKEDNESRNIKKEKEQVDWY